MRLLESFLLKISILLLAGAACLFFFRIGRNSLWTDELETAEVIQAHSQHDLWNPSHPEKMEEYFSHGFLAPYYSITKAWAGIFGHSEAALRALSAACATLALAMILFLGPTRWDLGPKVSLVAGCLFALSPMMLWYAQEARYYGLLQVLTLLACWFYLEYWNFQNGFWLAGWAGVSVLAMMTHPFMVFIVAAQGFYGLWLWKKREFSKAPCFLVAHGIATMGFLALLKPLLISSARVSAAEPYRLPTDELIPWKILSNYLSGIYEHPSPFLAWLLVLAATAAVVLHLREAFVESSTPQKENSIFWIITALGGCALMTLVSMGRPIMVEGKKYEIIFMAPFCVALARGLTLTTMPRFLPFLFLGVMALDAFMVDDDYFTKTQKQNWRLAGALVEHQARPGDIWIHQSPWREYATAYYAPGASMIKNVLWKPADLAGPPPTALKDAQRVWLVKTGAIADSYGERLEKESFHKTEYVLPSGSHFTTELWLFEKSPP